MRKTIVLTLAAVFLLAGCADPSPQDVPSSYFSSKEQARQCLQWERRLELAMENGRYFDLRRWGIASKTLNAFFEKEKDVVYDGQTYAQYYRDAHYTTGKNEYFPLPYIQLYYVPGLYTQNKGYN